MVTTLDKFKKQLPKNVLIDKVRYTDSSGVQVPVIHIENIASNYLAVEFAKIAPYRYENEIRAVFYSTENVAGYNVPVDITQMITKIFISPFATEEKKEILKKKLGDIFRAEILEFSEIDETEKQKTL